MAARGDWWDHRWRTKVVLLAVTAALVSALGFAAPARADDAPVDAAAAAGNEPAPTADQPTSEASGSEEPAPADPEPAPADPPPAATQPETEPAPQPSSDDPSVTIEPAPSEEPAVTLEPEPAPAPESCAEASGAEGAQSGTCEAGSEEGAATESPPAAPEETQAPTPEATAPSVAATPTAPPAAQPPAAAPVELVVSLTPETSATVPVPAETVAGPEDPPTAAIVVARWDAPADDAAVALASVPVHVARLAAGKTFLVSPAAAWPTPLLAPALSAEALTYLSRLPGAISTATISQGARAGPHERDGHREVATEAEPQSPSAQVGPPDPLDDQGPGASGGSAGGAPGSAVSSRYFAIATTPIRFDFPSAFADAPLSSSVPKGALEAAPTTRPG